MIRRRVLSLGRGEGRAGAKALSEEFAINQRSRQSSSLIHSLRNHGISSSLPLVPLVREQPKDKRLPLSAVGSHYCVNPITRTYKRLFLTSALNVQTLSARPRG